MKPTSRLFWILLTIGLLPAIAPPVQAFEPSPQSLQLARKRFRLSWYPRVRTSRYRVGGFSHLDPCLGEEAAVVFSPSSRPEEAIPRQSQPVDVTLSERPTFWVYVTSLPAKTRVQFVLQTHDGNRELK